MVSDGAGGGIVLDKWLYDNTQKMTTRSELG
jgi:hypothetical protein